MNIRIKTQAYLSTFPIYDFVRAGFQYLYELLFKPKMIGEDAKRKERILLIIISSTTLLSLIAELSAIYSFVVRKVDYPIDSFLFLTGINAVFIILFICVRKGYVRAVGYIFIIVFFLVMLRGSLTWGASLPTGLLIYALLITMAGIIIDTRFGLIVTLWSVAALLYAGMREARLGIIPGWKHTPVTVPDILVYSVILSISAVLAWLSNREMEKSLARARASEDLLQVERDNLEILVAERTEELRSAEREHIAELYRFAEFGKRSAGLFHDLVNPLTAISLTVESLTDEKVVSVLRQEARQSIANAVAITHRMEDYMVGIKKQIKSNETLELFSALEEIKSVKEFLRYQAREYKVAIEIMSSHDIELFGNALKFNQVISNLVANGIDAYEHVPTGNSNERSVRITATKEGTMLVIKVKDCGGSIPEEIMNKLFTPFFTTKEKGMGLGLATTKDIVEKDFRGTITVTSGKDQATTFTVRLPILTH
jgi:two-component system sensor histidine kinase HydH